MAEIAVNFLLDQLTTLLKEERNLLGGVKHEAQLIHDELDHMRAFLRVADSKEADTDPQLAVWLRQLREISYDTEDTLEDYIVLRHRHSSGIAGCFKKFCSSLKTLKARHRVASEIKAIRSRAKNAFTTYNDYKDKYPIPPAGSSMDSNESYDGRGDAQLLEEADIVGIRLPKMQLLDWILMSDYKFRVVAVVGMAGSGKTTLAKKVFDDMSLNENFDHHIWIIVSQTYKIENLLQEMIRRLLQEVKQPPPMELETMHADGMKEFIYNFLRDKKFILVLDDIWNVNAWEALKYAFPRTNTRGRGCIIITTRFINIGDTTCCESGGYVYHLQPLPPQDAEELFYRKAFSGDACPPHLKEISQNILKRCEGLPLAIVLIGGFLATKRDCIEEWTYFSNIGFGYEVEDDILKRMPRVISLSYYDLPYHMKACFLFLSNFPEDRLLEKATVIRLWLAIGFVEAKQGKTMEDTAEKYLNELCNRSLMLVAGTTINGRPNRFRVHDVIREYIISKAKEYGMVEGKCEGGIPLTTKVRCMVLDHCSIHDIEQMSTFKYIHTLLFFGSCGLDWESKLYKVLRSDCRMLKELDLRGTTMDVIPEEVFKLYHLKYLSLRNTKVSVIPKSIGNLEKLETLDLKETKVIGLPIEILKLQRLQFLLVYGYGSFFGQLAPFDFIKSFKAPYEIGRLVNLQKLCYIDASAKIEGPSTMVKEVGKLVELRRLGIVNVGEQDGNDLCSSLSKLDKLRSLTITSSGEGEMLDLQYSLSATHVLPFLRYLQLRGRLERVPQWVCCLNAMTTLHLLWSKLWEDPLKTLQGLPNLEVLYLRSAYEGEELDFRSGGFQKLKKLFLCELQGLRCVRVEKGSMPSLNTFSMTDCKSMMELPIGIENLSELREVFFINMSKDLVDNLYEQKKREEHGWKLSHVPHVYIGSWVDTNEWKVRLQW